MPLFARPGFVACAALAVIALLNARPSHLAAKNSTTLIISEVHPSGSSNATYAADWFEMTNTGTTAVDITGWKVDDNSNAFAHRGRAPRRDAAFPPGKSADLLRGLRDGSTDATIVSRFSTAWFGTPTPPAGVLVGAYGGVGRRPEHRRRRRQPLRRRRQPGHRRQLRRGDRRPHLRQYRRPRQHHAAAAGRHDAERRRRQRRVPVATARKPARPAARTRRSRRSTCPPTSASAASTCRSRPHRRRRPAACSRRRPRRSPTTGTPTRCSSSATAARRSSRSRRPAS